MQVTTSHTRSEFGTTIEKGYKFDSLLFFYDGLPSFSDV
ncbi:hypothetical protein J2W43_005605 [Pseudomonas brassicacearum]|uniref:Uncharacterized protein n=1 Tax=Pseudomonas brassicacearum TaxID=930166 RepID=A0AAW8MHI8_9PSED|nr:hypothetical protein [Pseudomonas brassicacearum]